VDKSLDWSESVTIAPAPARPGLPREPPSKGKVNVQVLLSVRRLCLALLGRWRLRYCRRRNGRGRFADSGSARFSSVATTFSDALVVVVVVVVVTVVVTVFSSTIVTVSHGRSLRARIHLRVALWCRIFTRQSGPLSRMCDLSGLYQALSILLSFGSLGEVKRPYD
jgi:hypothetical protein